MRAKLINESLNKYSFEKKTNPLVSLGVGKKAIISKWLDEMDVKNYNINDDYTININGDLDLSNKDLYKFPDYIQFNKVLGSFWLYDNYLENLKGCPNFVEVNFNCSSNVLNSLEGCPEYVGGWFDCGNNHLTSLKGCPKTVKSSFSCNDNDVEFTIKDVLKYCKKSSDLIYTK